MDTPPPETSTANYYTRRRILGWGGAGVVSAVCAYFVMKDPGSLGIAGNKAVVGGQKSREVTGNGTDVAKSAQEVSSAGGDLQREKFLPHVNSNFRIDSGVDCKLVEIGENMRISAPKETFVSFSLMFSAPKELAVESRIYRLSHPKLGDLDLFLSPVGRSEKCVYLEAVCCQRV